MTEILVIIKPWSIRNSKPILNLLDITGKRIKTRNVPSIPLETISHHYEPHLGKPFYSPMTHDFVGKQAIIAIYEGNCQTLRDSMKSARKIYDPEIEQLENPLIVRNTLHVSDSLIEARRELKVWEKHLR